MASTRAALSRFLVVLEGVVSVKPRNPPAQKAILFAELKRAANLISLALNSGQPRAYLRLSPSRAYPQLYVGRDNVESVLQSMWATVASGASVSATLYLYRSGGPHGGYSSGLLGIPDSRRAEYTPIEAPWLSDCISLVDIPSGERAARLRPPSRMDRLPPDLHAKATSAWLDAVSAELLSIHDTAGGGVLVLNTSYETIDGLAQRLAPLDAVMVCAKEGRSLSRQASAFLTLQQAGHKPIWLAVGSAWTGLDIGGHDPMRRLIGKQPLPASQDHVLTDLVIPRLPFGTNNSITHLRRTLTKPSVPWDLLDAAFRFRQGLGRLVRRKGLPHNRRIWVLDGRLADPDATSRLAVFLAPLTRLRNRITPPSEQP